MCDVQTAQRDATVAAIEANDAMRNQLQLVKEQIELFLQENANQAFSISQLRTNPSMLTQAAARIHQTIEQYDFRV